MTQDVVHVAYLRDNLADDYSRHMAASMVSVLTNCSKQVHFHIICGNSENCRQNNDNIHKYKQLIEEYNAKITYYPAHHLEEFVTHVHPLARKSWPLVQMEKFYFTDYFPDLSWIISIGSDVIVNTDLAITLERVSKINKGLFGVHDTLTEISIKENRLVFGIGRSEYDVIHNINQSNYVNDDILIWNLDYIREKKLLPEKATEYISKYNDLLISETAVNAIFSDHIYLLPKRYNLLALYDDVDEVLSEPNSLNTEGYLLHYQGSPKPWDEFYGETNSDYWYYLSKTPWGEGKKVFELQMRAMKTPSEILNSPLQYIWSHPLKEKIKILFNLSIGLWIGLFKQYWKQYVTHKI